MPRDPIPVWCFAIVIVRRADRFLLVQEAKPGEPWYLPAGRVEPGESFSQAACRETLEESGIPVQLTGILRIDHTPIDNAARLRVVFIAEPIDDTPPKSVPDAESLRAEWVTIDDLHRYPLRGDSVRELLSAVVSGQTVHPLSVLRSEDL